MMHESKKNSIYEAFFRGKCPCCDNVISVPSGTTKVFCCYCGSQFLSHAAIRLYGCKDEVVFGLNCESGLDKMNKKWDAKQEEVAGVFVPKMMTIRQLCKATELSESFIRRLVKQGKLPVIYSGNKAMINYTKVCEMLESLGD